MPMAQYVDSKSQTLNYLSKRFKKRKYAYIFVHTMLKSFKKLGGICTSTSEFLYSPLRMRTLDQKFSRDLKV